MKQFLKMLKNPLIFLWLRGEIQFPPLIGGWAYVSFVINRMEQKQCCVTSETSTTPVDSQGAPCGEARRKPATLRLPAVLGK